MSTSIIGKTFPGWTSFCMEQEGAVDKMPTITNRGIFRYYSYPIWAAGTPEALVFAMRVPFEWDVVTNPIIAFITSPTINETIGDSYNFQLKWASSDIGSVVPATTCETLTHQVELTTGTNAAFYAHILTFELDRTANGGLISGQNLQMELRRIASTGTEVAGEPAMYHWDTRWYINKMTVESQSGY